MENSLTVQQEKFVGLLVAGKSLSSISDELNVNRSTLYSWKELETVRARYNQLKKDIKENIESGLMGLYEKAVETIKGCLDSQNDQIRLKTALYLIERAELLSYGLTDPKEIIRKEATTKKTPFDNLNDDLGYSEEINQAYIDNRTKELGIN